MESDMSHHEMSAAIESQDRLAVRRIEDIHRWARIQSDHREGLFMQLACLKGNVSMVRMLLDRGVSANLETDTLCSPIYASAYARSSQTTELLLAHGSKPDRRPDDMAPPLFRAISLGRIETTRVLLRHGASRWSPWDGPGTLVEYAASVADGRGTDVSWEVLDALVRDL